MSKQPQTTIQVTGGGSGTGISALINGTTDICEASRAMKDTEKKQLAEKAGAPPVEITGRQGRPLGLRQRIEPADRADDGAAEGDLHRQGHVVEGARRPRREDHPVLAREQLGHLRLLQGARARERRLHAARADHARHGGGGERGGEGEVRDRLRRRRLREGDQGPQDQEGRRRRRRSRPPTRRSRTAPIRCRARCSSTRAPSRRPTIKAFTDWVLSPEGQAIVAKVGYFPLK